MAAVGGNVGTSMAQIQATERMNTQSNATSFVNQAMHEGTTLLLPHQEALANAEAQVLHARARAEVGRSLGLNYTDMVNFSTTGSPMAIHGGERYVVNTGAFVSSAPIAHSNQNSFSYAPGWPSQQREEVSTPFTNLTSLGSSRPSSSRPSIFEIDWGHGTISSSSHSSWPSTGSTNISSSSNSTWGSFGPPPSSTGSTASTYLTLGSSWSQPSSAGSQHWGSMASTPSLNSLTNIPEWAQASKPFRNPGLGLGLNKPFS